MCGTNKKICKQMSSSSSSFAANTIILNHRQVDKFTNLITAIRERKVETVRELISRHVTVEEMIEYENGRIFYEDIFFPAVGRPRHEEWRWIQDVLQVLVQETNLNLNTLPIPILGNILRVVFERHAFSVLSDLHTLAGLTAESALRAGMVRLALEFPSAHHLYVVKDVYGIRGVVGNGSNLTTSPSEQEENHFLYTQAIETATENEDISLIDELLIFYHGYFDDDDTH